MNRGRQRERDGEIYGQHLANVPRERIAEDHGVSLSTVDRAIRNGKAGGVEPRMPDEVARIQLRMIDRGLRRLSDAIPPRGDFEKRLALLSREDELLSLRFEVLKAAGMLKDLELPDVINHDLVSLVNRRLRLHLVALGVDQPLIEAALEDVIVSFEQFAAAQAQAVT